MSTPNDTHSIIIDNGACSCKAGFAGDQTPLIIASSLVGVNKETNDLFISNDAYQRADFLDIDFPIERGIITNWDEMEKLWSFIFQQLNADPAFHPVLLTDKTLNTKENREKMIQIMFESFNIPSFYVAKQAVLSLYSAGRLNGVVLDSGDSTSSATPIYGGYYIANTAVSTNLAGNDVTTLLQTMLNENGHNFVTFSQREIVRDIKEKLCYLSADYDAEIQKHPQPVTYSLPDGSNIQLGHEIFSSSECLFNPQLNGFPVQGLSQILCESIEKCDAKIHQELYSSIVISGGTTKLNNFAARIEKEMVNHVQSNASVKIIEPHKRHFASWIGGSIFASLPAFQSSTISSQEYNESGSNIVRKCS